MSDKITYKFAVGFSGLLNPSQSSGAVHLGGNPKVSYDNHGNQHFGDTLVCADKGAIDFPDNVKDAVFTSVDAATMGQSPDAQRSKGILGALGLAGTIEETYDLGDLPSPLQTACEKASHER